MKIPLIKGFLATRISVAFLLSSLVVAISAVLAIEMRMQLENEKSSIYEIINNIIPGNSLSLSVKMIIVCLTAFIANLLTLNILHILFGYGSAYIIDDKFKQILPKY